MSPTMNRCQEVLASVRRIIRAIDLHSRFLVQNHGLTGPQLVLLQEVSRMADVTVGELATRASLSPPTVTAILDRLEKSGLVERKRSVEDRRRVHIAVTPAGKELLLESPPPLQQRFVTEFEALSDWEQTQILASLQRIASMMDASTLEAAPLLSSGPLTDDTETETEAIDETVCLSDSPTDHKTA